jgi:hypothetical protein
MSKKSYSDVVQRLCLSSGKYEFQSNNGVFYVMESNIIRAVINPIKGTRYHTSGNKNLYKVTLDITGQRAKYILDYYIEHNIDATHICTWEEAREIIHTHLQDIDRYLERPISNYWIPYENGRVVPRIGDVVVFTKPETSYIGELGVIKEFINRTGSYHIENGFFYPNQKGDFYADEFEVIDHDPSLLDEPADGKAEVLIEGKHLVFEEDGWEYWLEKSADNGLYLNKRCKGCGSLHPRVVRNIS